MQLLILPNITMTKEFIRISNEQIYKRLVVVESKIDKINKIKWIASISLTISLLTLGFLIEHIGR